MNELIEFINSLDFENNSYFYHITGKGYGYQIIENGLFLKDKSLNKTAIEIPQEMISNPTEYCESEFNNIIVKREEMVIIACEKGEQNYIVKRTSQWIENEKFNYVVPSEYILGFINLNTMAVTYNPEYGYGGKYV